RAMGLEEGAKSAEWDSGFTDEASIAGWAKPHIALAAQIGFIKGIPSADGTLRYEPKGQADRQAMARLVYELMVHREGYTAAAEAAIAGVRGVIVEGLSAEGLAAGEAGTMAVA